MQAGRDIWTCLPPQSPHLWAVFPFSAALCKKRGENWRFGEDYSTPTYRGELEAEMLLTSSFFWLQKEAACFFTFGEGWYHLVRTTLRQRHPQSQDIELEGPVRRQKRNTSRRFVPFLFGFGFPFVCLFLSLWQSENLVTSIRHWAVSPIYKPFL